MYVKRNRINGFVESKCKTEKRNSQHEHGQPMGQTRKQEACLERAAQVWLTGNRNTSVGVYCTGK